MVVNDQQPVDRATRDGGVRRTSSASASHPRHCRKDRAETVLAVETFGDKSAEPCRWRVGASFCKKFHGQPNDVDAAKQQEPDPALMRRLRRAPIDAGGSTKSSSMRTPSGFFARGRSAIQHQQRHQKRFPRPIGHLDKWKGNQLGNNTISTGISGTLRQSRMPYGAREDVGTDAPPREKIASRARRMCRRWPLAGHFQPEIGLRARRCSVEIALVKERPSPVRPLDALEINGDFPAQAPCRSARHESGEGGVFAGIVASALDSNLSMRAADIAATPAWPRRSISGAPAAAMTPAPSR